MMQIRSTLVVITLTLVALGVLGACDTSPGNVTPGQPTSSASTGTPNYVAFSEREAVNEGLPSSAGDDPARVAGSASVAKNICSMLDGGTLPVDIETTLSDAGAPGNPAVEVQLAKALVCPNAG